jgi:hypothetical protein
VIIHAVEQGTPEWKALRLGIPTASEFERIVTPTGQLSKQATAYAARLVAERFLGKPLDEIGDLFWVSRGRDLEGDAVLAYEFERNCQTRPGGFMTTDDGRVGASPDRLVDGGGAVEIKCPAPATHVKYMLEGFGNDHRVQTQGQMFVGDFRWIDRVSFYPGLPLVIERSERDEVFIERLAKALAAFCLNLDEITAAMEAKGAIFPDGRGEVP